MFFYVSHNTGVSFRQLADGGWRWLARKTGNLICNMHNLSAYTSENKRERRKQQNKFAD